MKIVRAALLLLALIPALVQAASVPSYSPKFGQAMAGVAAQKVTNRGFAANDPRFAATTVAISTALTATATAVAGAAGLPIWASIAIGATVAAGIALAADSVYKWIWNSDGTISTAGAGPVDPATGYVAMSSGQQYWSASGYMGGSPESAFYAWFRDPSSGHCGGGDCAPGQYGDYVQRQVGAVTDVYQSKKFEIQSRVHYANGDVTNWSSIGFVTPNYNASGAPQSCVSGSYSYNGGTCATIPMPQSNTSSGGSDVTNGTPAQAVSNIPESEMAKPVNPQLVADAVNKAWQQAALQPGYMGLPYDAANPVTATDVQAWQSANPSAYPSVSDFVAPAVSPSTSTVPFAPPGVQTTTQGTQYPGINSAPEGSAKVDLGYDPAIPLPSLENTPTGSEIFKPISDGVAPWTNFTLPGHTSACPTASFTWWQRTHVMDAHCTLIANNQATITTAMYALWVLVALFIILGA